MAGPLKKFAATPSLLFAFIYPWWLQLNADINARSVAIVYTKKAFEERIIKSNSIGVEY